MIARYYVERATKLITEYQYRNIKLLHTNTYNGLNENNAITTTYNYLVRMHSRVSSTVQTCMRLQMCCQIPYCTVTPCTVSHYTSQSSTTKNLKKNSSHFIAVYIPVQFYAAKMIIHTACTTAAKMQQSNHRLHFARAVHCCQPFLPIGDAAYGQHAGGGPSHG